MRESGPTSIGSLIFHRILPVDQVISDSTTVRSPILVKGGHCQKIGDIHTSDEIARLVDQAAHLGDRSGVDRCLTIGVDRSGHATDEEALQMRILSAEDCVHADDVALPIERLEVVRHCHEVCFRR